MSRVLRVPLEAITDNATTIMKCLDLPKLLPKLREKQALSEERLARLENPAHSVIERTGYLLQYVKKLHQKGVDVFIQSLREAKCEGHETIIKLLEESASEEAAQSPLLEVFETRRADILSQINFTTFINKMVEMELISVHENMEVYNPHRSTEENTMALVALLMERPGAQGLLKFIECLHEDSSPGHKSLATTLLNEANQVVQDHPRRGDIPHGDKTQLLYLERWKDVGTPNDAAMKKAFKTHEARLCKEVNVAPLMPSLLKKRVITSDEGSQLNDLKVEERAPRLVAMVSEKGMRSIVTFVECIKQSQEHEKLARLFMMATAPKPLKSTAEKTSKLAVMLCMDSYLELVNDYEVKERNIVEQFNKDLHEHRDTLRVCLERLEFSVVDFGEVLSKKSKEGKTPTINSLFDKEVASRCYKDGIVFIYISGHQFPLKLEDDKSQDEKFSGAVLLDGESVISRRRSDCIHMEHLRHWVELLPTDYVTFLIDCHHSHVVSYGKERLPSDVEIMTDPWSVFSLTHGVVLYFCQPDPEAMWRLRGTKQERDSVLGLLTDIFVKTLISWIRRGHKVEVSHRLFYESITFHWHKGGRVCPLFVPAIQGDVDRSFLGSSSFPYLQALRADLVPNKSKDSTDKFDLTKLQVATGSQMGLIKDDELIVFHVLQPEVKVTAKVTRAHPLSSIAEIREEDRQKFSRLLNHTYEDVKISPDGSTEFVFLKKKFPLHMRDNYAVICQGVAESDTETIKNYIKTSSQLLSYAHNRELARMVVKKVGQFFTVEDCEMKPGENGKKQPAIDILFKPRVKTIQNVKSVLEIMAWFKHVKNLRSQTDLTHFLCYLVCEKPLLTQPPPSNDHSDPYQIKASTHTKDYPASEAVLQFSDRPRFWCPGVHDPTPTLEVEFKQNRVVTAVEVRGNPEVKGHVKKAELNYRKFVFTKDCSAPNPTELDRIPVSCQEKAWFVTFKPLEWDQNAEFCIALRLLASFPGRDGTRPHSEGVANMSVMYWSYLQRVAGWRIAPEPVHDQSGNGILDLGRTEHMLRWSGNKPYPITFDLNCELLVERIEVACVPGTKPLRKFSVELCSKWLNEEIGDIPSSWPFRFQLSKPLVVSNLQFCPTEKSSEEPINVQLQIYGNTEEKTVVAEENDILQLHFVNYTNQRQFVYLYFLEETGKVEIVFADVVPEKNGLKKLIKVNIPEGYDPDSKKITDQYRVLVSPKKIYLEVLNQLGLHEYMGVRSYNICSLGRRTDIGKDEQWYEYKFKVVIKKGMKR